MDLNALHFEFYNEIFAVDGELIENTENYPTLKDMVSLPFSFEEETQEIIRQALEIGIECNDFLSSLKDI